jgi:hypothetical protein
MFTQISQLIRAFHGYAYVSAGTINGYFDAPDDAKLCAEQIKDRFRCDVHLCGCELSMAEWEFVT